MFQVDVPLQPYSHPWKVSFLERQRAFFRGRPRVAYLYERPDNSTFRYRAYNMCQALSQHPTASAAYFWSAEYELLDTVIAAADTLVICRCRYTSALARLLLLARERGVRILFDVDDFVFEPAMVPLIVSTLDENANDPEVWNIWHAYVGRVGAILHMCEGAITTNRYLANQITNSTGVPATVIPNFMNREQLTVSEQIFARKQAAQFQGNGQIHLGYFSGSPTHNKDLDLAANGIARILELDPRVRLHVVGYMDNRPALVRYASRIEFLSFVDFVKLQCLVGAVEFNLMPLVKNSFTDCKSELKYFEAGAVGTVSIASPSYTYAGAIRDGETGYLAHDHEWEDKLRQAIVNLDHYAQLATAARNDSLARYSWSNFTDTIANVLFAQPLTAALASAAS